MAVGPHLVGLTDLAVLQGHVVRDLDKLDAAVLLAAGEFVLLDVVHHGFLSLILLLVHNGKLLS